MNEAHAFREVSLKSDEFLRQQRESGIIVKSEPIDNYNDDDYFNNDDDNEPDLNDYVSVIKTEVKQQTNEMTNFDFVLESENLAFESVLVHDEGSRKRGRKKRSNERRKSPKLETPQAMQNSMRAKIGWSQGVRENLIKECPYCFLGGMKKSILKKHIQQHIGEFSFFVSFLSKFC